MNVSPKRKNGFLGFIKNLVLFLLLIAIIGASFWVSFLLGRKILVPVKKIPKQRIEVAILEAPPSIAAMQRLEEVMIEEQARAESPAVVAKPEPVKKQYSREEKHYYKVQAGLYSDKNNANNFAKKLQAGGFATYIKRVNSMWRVQVGAFYKNSQAQHLQNNLSAKGFESTIVYE